MMSTQQTTELRQVQDLEDRSRRQSLIFYGITERRGESWKDAEEEVVNLCKSFGLCPRDLQLYIDRAHRLGLFTPGRIRPIIVCFTYYKDKEAILRNAKNL